MGTEWGSDEVKDQEAGTRNLKEGKVCKVQVAEKEGLKDDANILRLTIWKDRGVIRGNSDSKKINLFKNK